MVTKTHDEPSPAAAMAEGVLIPADPLTAQGVGEVFEATREFIAGYLKPEIITVTEPFSGDTTLAVVTPGGRIDPLPSTFFGDVSFYPRFRRGTAAMTTLDSFIAHVNRFGDEDTAVFADDRREAPKLTAVLDYHRADSDVTVEAPGVAPVAGRHIGTFRHGKHRTTFAFPLSDEWKAWQKADGVKMNMGAFALFLEDRIGDIAIAGDEFPEDVERFVNVNGGTAAIADFATLVELSRGLKVHEQSNVEEAQNLSSGEGHIRFSVEHQTRNAANNVVRVPTMFFIAIPVFNKGVYYRIGARLRYRKTPDGVVFWFDLYRSDRSFDDAFREAVARVGAETPAAVFFGSPEA